jgi:hypothetical protein
MADTTMTTNAGVSSRSGAGAASGPDEVTWTCNRMVRPEIPYDQPPSVG